jgi:hypothetical protein
MNVNYFNKYIHTGCIMKNLWCWNFLIFHTILINDVSNKIILNGLQFEWIQYLFLSSVLKRIINFFFFKLHYKLFLLSFIFYFEYENVNNHAHA